MGTTSADFSDLVGEIKNDILNGDNYLIEIESAIKNDILKRKTGEWTYAGEGVIDTLVLEIAARIGTNYMSGEIGPDIADKMSFAVKTYSKISAPIVHGRIVTFDVYVPTDDAIFHRYSMLPDKYPRGVDSIIELLNSGYSARRSVSGKWHNRDHVSISVRAGAGYFDNLMDEFMDQYAWLYNVTSIYEK